MDDEEQKFDPVTPGALNDIRPGFLGGNGGGGGLSGGLSGARAAEEGATGGLYRPGGNATNEAKSKEKAPGTGGLYKNGAGAGGAGGIGGRLAALRGGRGGGKGASGKAGKGGKGKLAGKMPMMAGGAAIVVCMIGLLALTTPTLMIGALDYNMQQFSGMFDTIQTLKLQGMYVTDELIEEGEVATEYAERLEENGIEVGQVTAAGEFVRTNTYIAGLGEDIEVAANGSYQSRGSGELVLKFKDQIIRAGEFVAAAETDPELYAAYSAASDLPALYYYGKDVNAVYKEMDVSRDAFNGWERTGSSEKDQESFNQILNKMLDSESALTVADCTEDNCDQTKVSDRSDAGEITSDISNKTKELDVNAATSKAAALLNTAVSAGEPYLAVRAFAAVEEPLQQARYNGGGPVNELMNVLSEDNEVTYVDVNTGEEVTKKTSILNSANFAAAASAGKYSREEAANFSRDRVFTVTGTKNSANPVDTTVASNGQEKTNSVVGINLLGGSADQDVMSKANNAVEIATITPNSETFATAVGGNRVVEGGSFLSNTIDQRVLGSMPSDSETIMAYHQHVEKMLALQAEADRATLSPFDVSSPNTFLGSIVHKMAAATIRNWSASGESSLMTTVSAVADVAGKSTDALFGKAMADGNDDSYSVIKGDCVTVKEAANVEGDLYCTAHRTLTTKYVNYKNADWKDAMGDNLTEAGRIKSKSELSEFNILGMDRSVTVGTKSGDVCEEWKKNWDNDWLGKVGDALSRMFNLYESCGRVDDSISTGANYALSGENGNSGKTEEFVGFTLHDEVYSLLSSQMSKTAMLKEEYYKENPKDESAAGIVARASGMTKEEAELALTYATYLAMLNEYDASERFAFGETFDVGETILVEHSNKLGGELYAVWSGRAKYADVRNRSFAV